MVEPGGRSGGGSGVGWTADASATTAAASLSPSSYAAANLSPLPAKIGVGGGGPAAASNYHQYPAPLAKYEDVVANPKLFMDTLEKLHAHMRTKFMIPIIGGKELDLHQLFVEVTSRGGIDKILREKKWKEVTAVFNFPSTATNASFVLRKYYYSLLQHYEQIYYFKAQGWTPLPAGSLHSPSSVVPIAVHGVVPPPLPHQPNSATPPQQSTTTTKNPNPTLPPAAAPPQSSPSSPVIGCPVVGVIDGKFESGYLVTVTIGTEKLKGVLYQSPPSNSIHHHHQQSPLLNPTENNNNNSNNNNSSINTNNPTPPALGVQVQPRKRRRRRKKSEIRRRDPAHPKPNRSGYNFFFAEQHARLKPLYPGKDREISRMIGELWTNLKDNDKSVYQAKAVEDKERYRLEMAGYREKLKTGQVISNAVPIRQRLPDLDVNMVEVDVKEGEDAGTKDSAEIDDQSSGSSGSVEDEEEEEDEEEGAAETVGGVEKDDGHDGDDTTNNTGTAAENMSNVVIDAAVAETKVDDSGGNQKQPCVVNIASQEGPGGGRNIGPAAPTPPEEVKRNMVVPVDSEKEKPVSAAPMT